MGAWFCVKVVWFTRHKAITHPGTNRAWRKVTTLIETKVLPLSQTGKKAV